MPVIVVTCRPRPACACTPNPAVLPASCPCASSTWDAVEMEPALAEAYGRMLKRVTFALDKALMFAIFAGFGCGIGYVATLRIMRDELALFFFLLYAVMSLSGYLMTFAQIALFNRVLPRGVRLTFRILRKRFPDLGSSVMDFIRMIVLAGLILFGLMALTR